MLWATHSKDQALALWYCANTLQTLRLSLQQGWLQTITFLSLGHRTALQRYQVEQEQLLDQPFSCFFCLHADVQTFK